MIAPPEAGPSSPPSHGGMEVFWEFEFGGMG